MLRALKTAFIPAFCLLTISLVTSCAAPGSTPGTAAGPQAGDPAVGTKISAEQAVGYFPEPRTGLHYVYLGTERKGQTTQSTRLEAEVAEVNGKMVKLRANIAGEAKVIDVDTSKPPVLPAGGLTFEGRENLGIPAGNFNAQKFSYSQNNNTINVWAVKGIGILKTHEQRANGETMTVELQSYRH